MKTPSLVTDYSRLSDANLEFKGQSIILSLTGNPTFPVTTPTLADFTALKVAFSTSLANALDGGRTNIAIKNTDRLALINSMRFLAANIESLAQGDKAKLLSSGFDLSATGETVPPLSAPVEFKLVDGINPGEISSVVKPVAQAVAYSHEYTFTAPDEATVWSVKSGTSRKILLSGLPSGQRIFVRVAAIGRKGQEAYTNTLSRVVQ
ncbi:hypothetical protein [Pedobacter arcticus]|uniref:hypothetical protein n=1 Tax=Pedobacter arcticus TaxID=752140 RepID=UPI000311C5AB|nr:hypothetical protein [Pedobacter arcticus]